MRRCRPYSVPRLPLYTAVLALLDPMQAGCCCFTFLLTCKRGTCQPEWSCKAGKTWQGCVQQGQQASARACGVCSSQDSKQRNPFLPYEEALWVRHLSRTHTLLLNKFNVVAHHLICVTREFEQQTEPLNAADLEATWTAMQVTHVTQNQHCVRCASFSTAYTGGALCASKCRSECSLAYPKANCIRLVMSMSLWPSFLPGEHS